MARDEVQLTAVGESARDATSILSRLVRRTGSFARRHPLGFISGVAIAALVFVTVAAPLVAPYDPTETNPADRKQASSITHPMGTDLLGRDILSRVIYGGRVSLQVAVVAVLLGTVGGALWGIVSGYIGGGFDTASQRVLEVFMGFPALILAMVFLVGFGAGVWTVTIAIAVTRLPFATRVIRSVVVSVKESSYVDAARAVGGSGLRIMTFHIAPQCLAPFLVLATTQLGVVIIVEASLGFLGLSIPPPTPTWGNMLGGAVAALLRPHWPLVAFPGLMIFIVVLAFNFLGDAVRDTWDPKLRGQT